jgi:hypothetical protein
MKKVLLLTLAVIGVSSLAYGQDVGSIDIFSDAAFTNCNIAAPPAGTFVVYVAQTHVGDGTTAVQFKIDHPPTFSVLAESSPFALVLGDSDTGIAISYTTCQTGTFLILTITYLAEDVSAPCGLMTIAPDPDATGGGDRIKFVDCNDNQHYDLTQAGQARVNPDVTCTCNYLPVQETTWGGIKALYQD